MGHTRRRTMALLGVVPIAAALAGCGASSDGAGGGVDSGLSSGEQAAIERAQEPGCRAQRRATTYADVGLRKVTPPGYNARAFRTNIADRVDAEASASDERAAGLEIYSLGDGDSTGDPGEEINPKDREDVAVLFRPLTPGARTGQTRKILAINVRRAEAAFREQGGKGVKVDVTSKITGNVARITGTFDSEGVKTRERLATAFTDCALIEVLGWPDQVERFLQVATRAEP